MDDPFAKTLSGIVTGRLENAGSELGRPYDGRWTWFKRKLRMRRVTAALQQAPPVTVNQYRQAAATVGLMAKDLRRTRRRQLFMLWIRIVLVSLIAILRRFWWVFAGIVVVASLVAALVYAGPYIASMFPAAPAIPAGPQSAPVVQP
jgi:hypothetical protein